MKKVHLQRLLKLTALVLPIVLIVLFLQQYVYVYNDSNTERIRKFYQEEKDSLDVVFLGASEVFSGYAPGYAYGQYGYTSYMYAMDANVGSLYKAQLQEILSRQTPERIIVEVFGFTRPDDTQHAETNLRYFTQSIPYSCNRFNTIMNSEYDRKISCLLPFIKYHGNTELLESQLIYYGLTYETFFTPSLNKGMVTETTIFSGQGYREAIDDTNGHLYQQGKSYLLDFLEYCRQEKLDNVVFVNFPRHLDDEDHNALLARVADIEQLVTDYGFEFLDLQKEFDSIGLDVSTDFYNPHHLNAFGQQKLTDYFGDLLINRYRITPRAQSPENQVLWLKSAAFADEYFTVAADMIARGDDFYLSYDAEVFYHADPSAVQRIDAITDNRSKE